MIKIEFSQDIFVLLPLPRFFLSALVSLLASRITHKLFNRFSLNLTDTRATEETIRFWREWGSHYFTVTVRWGPKDIPRGRIRVRNNNFATSAALAKVCALLSAILIYACRLTVRPTILITMLPKQRYPVASIHRKVWGSDLECRRISMNSVLESLGLRLWWKGNYSLKGHRYSALHSFFRGRWACPPFPPFQNAVNEYFWAKENK